MISRVLTIAGSDSGGGAGIQADIKTITALGGFATSVLTALTAQNTRGITAVMEVPPDFVRKQIKAVLSDIGADAMKTGMLSREETIVAIADELRSFAPNIPLVVDPIMVAKDGTRLLDKSAHDALKRDLFPIAAIVTPNIPEAEELLGFQIKDLADMRHASEMLMSLGPKSVLVTGGHMDVENIPNVLTTDRGQEIFSMKRVHTPHTHGTGCTLGSAIATRLAQGALMEEAVRDAVAYVACAVQEAPGLGKGQGPLLHLNSFSKKR